MINKGRERGEGRARLGEIGGAIAISGEQLAGLCDGGGLVVFSFVVNNLVKI